MSGERPSREIGRLASSHGASGEGEELESEWGSVSGDEKK